MRASPLWLGDGSQRESIRIGDAEFATSGALAPIVHVALGGRVGLYFEHPVLHAKDPHIQLVAKTPLGGARRVLGNTRVFILEAQGMGMLALARGLTGQVVAIELRQGESIHVREHQFVLATHDVEYDFVRIQGHASTLSQRETFFIDRFTCEAPLGLVIVAGSGDLTTYSLEAGQQLDVEPAAFLWKDASVKVEESVILLATGLLGNSSTTLNRFGGPGRLCLQSGRVIAPSAPDIV